MLKFIKLNVAVLFIIFIFAMNFSFTTANAQTAQYFRVLNDDVYIYQDQSFLEPIFKIPKTYYVKAESILGSAVKVSYGDGGKDCPQIVGYVKLEEVTKTESKPTNPFSIIKVSTDTSDILFNDFELKTPYFNVFKNEILYYYGEISYNDKVLCYVYYSNKLGYIDKTCLNPFSIPLNQDPTTDTQAPPTDEPSENDKVTPSQNFKIGENLQIIIIVGISVISISVVYFLFKPQKNKTENEQCEFNEE